MQILSLFRSVLDYESMPEYKVKIRVNTLSAFINPKETKIYFLARLLYSNEMIQIDFILFRIK